MSTAPAAEQRRLLEVQALDTRLDQLAHRRRGLDVLARIEKIEERAAEVGTELVTVRTAHSDVRRELAKAELDVEQVRTRAQRNQSRLDAGQGTAKDMQALTHELEALARRQAELEDVELEVMERLEALDTQVSVLEAHAAALAVELSAAVAERDSELAVIDEEASTVRSARDVEAEQISEPLFLTYERLRAQHGGVGAALLRGSRCEGCRLDLNAGDVARIRAAAEDEVIRCEECGRILVRAGAREG